MSEQGKNAGLLFLKGKSVGKKRAKKAKKNSIARPVVFNDERFRVDNAADTMMKFQEINADPKLKSKAKKELARREKAIKKARTV